jgi:hypothetical protein
LLLCLFLELDVVKVRNFIKEFISIDRELVDDFLDHRLDLQEGKAAHLLVDQVL